MPAAKAKRRDTLNIRIKPEVRGLIDRAAEEALLDRAMLVASPKAFEAFRARLDEPPHPNEELRRTLQSGEWGVAHVRGLGRLPDG